MARAGGREEPVQLNFTHDELTALVADWGHLDHWFGSIESMQLALQPGKLVLSGVIQTLGLEFPFRLDVHASIENKQRTVELTRLQIGELFAPGFVRNIALELALRTVDAGLPRVPIETESLVLGGRRADRLRHRRAVAPRKPRGEPGGRVQRGNAPRTPPSTGSTAPVVLAERSEARNNTVSATSAELIATLRRLRPV